MRKLMLIIGGLLIVASFIYGLTKQAESNSEQQDEQTAQDPRFGDYWYQGLAELNSYELKQARYGEIREGEAVLIFVTEDFSKDKQVKLDRPGEHPEDALKVLKLNQTKNFLTGVYPYSMMASIFTPVDHSNYPHTVKVTASSQEWCGHTFSQLNLRPDSYLLRTFSYFESEGDRERLLGRALLEDELWNAIRLYPDDIPEGEVEVIPSLLFSRLKHIEEKPGKAHLSIEDTEGGMKRLTLDYTEIERTLTIDFRSEFPHEIQSWSERYSSGFGENARIMETTARLKKRIMLDYWTKNGVADTIYRDSLLLDGNDK